MSKVLFWDFDGTLVHPNESFRDSLCATFSSAGKYLPPEQARAFLQTACSWYHPEEVYPHRTGSAWWDTLFAKCHPFYAAQGFSPPQYASLDAEFRTRICSPEHYTLYEDALSTLEACSSLGYTHYLLSNNFPELTGILRAFGLEAYFAGVILSSQVGYEKPHPALFRHALQLAGHPTHCYMIGDNPVADVQGANSVGMPAFLVHRSTSFPADFHCASLADIPAHLSL